METVTFTKRLTMLEKLHYIISGLPRNYKNEEVEEIGITIDK